MLNFGKIKKVDIRTIWENEAYHFTPWLADNINKLGEILGKDLELIEKESDVGDFSLDILAKDISKNKNVVIENQFGSTDHKHLGQLLTYAAGYDASAIIWISEDLREEHRQTIDWLNENIHEDIEFYGVVIEVIQIDDSKPAFNFKLISFPNSWSKEKNKISNVSPKAELYRELFQELIDKLRNKYKFTEAKKGQPQSWYSFSSGINGITYAASFAQGQRLRAEIYIDKGDKELNKKLFDILLEKKENIEKKFNEKLDWERLDEKRASRIAIYKPGSIKDNIIDNEDNINWFIDRLLKFKDVFIRDEHIRNILKNISRDD